MVSKKVFIVFILPVVFSVVFGSLVMDGILQKPDRELNMWPMSHTEMPKTHGNGIEIVGLLEQYSVTQPVEVSVSVSDSSFDCGDLYVTIYSAGSGNVVTQSGYFSQCFEKDSKNIPIDDKFSAIVDKSGSYEIVAQMISPQLDDISAKKTFTVK